MNSQDMVQKGGVLEVDLLIKNIKDIEQTLEDGRMRTAATIWEFARGPVPNESEPQPVPNESTNERRGSRFRIWNEGLLSCHWSRNSTEVKSTRSRFSIGIIIECNKKQC